MSASSARGTRGQDYLRDVSALVDRVRTVDLTASVQDPAVDHVGIVSPVNLSSSGSVQSAQSVKVDKVPLASVSVCPGSVASASFAQVLVTPLSTRLRGGVDSDFEEMVIINTGPKFLTAWAGAADDAERKALEDEHLNNGDTAVVVEVMKKMQQRSNALVAVLTTRTQAAEDSAQAARAQADAAITAQVAQAAQVNQNSDQFKPRAPPTFSNQPDKDMDIKKWLDVVEDHLFNCSDDNYMRTAASYLGGKPRSFWQSKYELRKADVANPIADVRAFFRETMISGYGLKEEKQAFWDNWNNLKMKSGEDINDYTIAFTQAATDLSDEIQGEQVKIERYKLGLQSDMREAVRSDPLGKRWSSLADLISYCTLQWPVVKTRLDKRAGGSNKPTEKVGGKRKVTSPGRGRPNKSAHTGGASGSGSKSASAKQMDGAEKANDRRLGLCHICKSPDHFSKDCPDRKTPWQEKKPKNGGRKKDFA